MNYYNEFDPNAAAWLRGLIEEKLIPAGEVDTRSICDVAPADLAGYTQCHFFAGIGGWSLALRLAGVPDDSRLWTGSAPCQPWSHANVWQGGGRGHDDERHLAPVFLRLIRKCSPAIIFGEQVSGAVGKGWLDQLFTELEAEHYACGALILPANAFGADHERKRLFWTAYAGGSGREGRQHIECISFGQGAAQPIAGDCFTRARSALDGDFKHLLLGDGVSVGMERAALKGYGNAIVPQVAAEFIKAAFACIADL